MNIETKVATNFERLLIALNTLCLHINDDLMGFEAYMLSDGRFIQSHDKVIYALKKLTLPAKMPPQETQAFPGAIAATIKTIGLIKKVNAAKDQFKATVASIKSELNTDSSNVIREALAMAGHHRMRLKHIYRHIRYVEYTPNRIAFSKTKESTNKIVDLETAERLLLKTGQGEHIDIQLTKLSLLDKSTKLVIKRDIKPIWTVNITRVVNNAKHYQKIPTSLPMFYLTSNDTMPVVCLSKPAHRDKNSIRSDMMTESKPFLPSIKAYRYKNNHKQKRKQV